MDATSSKRHRYQPHAGGLPMRFTSTSRYGRLLWHIYLHRYSTAEQLAALLYLDELTGKWVRDDKRLKSPTVSLKGVQRSLNLLWNNNWIAKRIHKPKNTMTGSYPDIYTLAPKGAEYLAEMMELFLDEIKYPVLPAVHKPHRGEPQGEFENLWHNLRVTDVLVNLQLCSHELGLKVVHFCHDEVIKEKFTARIQGKKTNLSVLPDGLVIIENSQGQRANFFLEVDRATERLARIQHKFQSYLHWQEQGLHRDFMLSYYRDHAEDLLPAGMDVENLPSGWLNQFRVLFAVLGQTDKRIRSMQKTAWEVYSAQPQLEVAQDLFAFTRLDYFCQLFTRVECVSQAGNAYSKVVSTLENAKQIGESIWLPSRQAFAQQPFSVFR